VLATRWRPWALTVAAFVAITALVCAVLVTGGGLWDWDTYERLQFISVYRPDLTADTHVLYHHVMRAMLALGLAPSTSVVLLTATAAAAYVVLVAWIALREGLTRARLALVLVAATLGSPGLVSLVLLQEDNVPYLPLVLGVFYLLYRTDADDRAATRSALGIAVLLAAAMLLNISLLVVPLALVPVPLWWRSHRMRARRAAIAVMGTLVVYYAVHLIIFRGARIALHEFLPQALQLRDTTVASAPLVSLERAGQYLGGLRAVALDPSVHLMQLPTGVHTALVVIAPKVLALLYGALAVMTIRRHGAALAHGVWARLDVLAVGAVAVAFPYLYEPVLVERWDVAWLGLLLALVIILAREPSRWMVRLVVAIVVVQGLGGLVTLVHHRGHAFVDPRFVEARAIGHELRARDRDPVLLPASYDRLLLADLTTRAPGRQFYLVRDDGPEVTCLGVYYLTEQPVPLVDVRAALARAQRPYLSPALSPRARAALTGAR